MDDRTLLIKSTEYSKIVFVVEDLIIEVQALKRNEALAVEIGNKISRSIGARILQQVIDEMCGPGYEVAARAGRLYVMVKVDLRTISQRKNRKATIDPWTPAVEESLATMPSPARIDQVISAARYIDSTISQGDRTLRSRATQMRVALIMRRLGWTRRSRATDGKQYRLWERPANAVQDAVETPVAAPPSSPSLQESRGML